MCWLSIFNDISADVGPTDICLYVSRSAPTITFEHFFVLVTQRFAKSQQLVGVNGLDRIDFDRLLYRKQVLNVRHNCALLHVWALIAFASLQKIQLIGNISNL